MKYRLQTIALSLLMYFTTWAEVTLGIPGEEAASIGIYVKDLSTGKVLASNDPSRVLLPASVMKSVTAAAALSLLPNDFVFKTPVYLYGQRDKLSTNKWNGNLIVESCGDPTIDSALFPDSPLITNEIMRGLNDLGIDTITGQIVVSESLFQSGCVPEWEVSDVAWEYGAGLYGFNYRDNSYDLWPASGDTRPHDAYLQMSVFPLSSGTELLRGISSDVLEVYGREPENPKWKVDLSMNNPSDFFITEMQQLFADCDLILQGREISDISTRQIVCTHVSPALVDILRKMMVESHNLFAEGMQRALAPDGSRQDAIDTEKAFLGRIGVPTAYAKICDGSGLARADRISPLFISTMLEAMAKSPQAEQYVSLFPKVGVEGTVRRLLENSTLKGKLALKSGSMNGVQCFAGYKIDNDGKPTHTVVILVNGFFCPRATLRTSIEKFLLRTLQ